MALKSGVVVKELMKLGVMANINQVIDQETAFLAVEELGHKPVAAVEDTIEDELTKQFESIESEVRRGTTSTDCYCDGSCRSR